MQDYTNHLYNTIVIDRLATWGDYCQAKPHAVKEIVTASGQRVYVHKASKRNKARYWHWQCGKCDRQGLVRADTLRLWARSDHQCQCVRAGQTMRKRIANRPAFKVCPNCLRALPTTKSYWYVTKRGYLGHWCKRCIRLCKPRHEPKSKYVYPHAFKRCPKCTRNLPATRNFWYITKRGYLGCWCKRCRRAFNMFNYKYKLGGNDYRRNAGGGFIDG